MKFLVLAACLLSVASGYKQFISVGGRNVITDDGSRSSGSGGRGSGGSGLSGASAFGGAGAGAGSGASWSSGASSGSWGAGAGRGGSKGLAGSGSLAAIASPVNKYKASGYSGAAQFVQPTQVVNAAPSIPFVSGGYAEQQQISASPIGSLAAGGWGADSGAALASAAPASGGVITAAVITRYNVQYVDVPSQGGQPVVQQIVIPAKSQPLEISFESASSPINVRQVHRPGQAAAPQVSSHQEEPDILKQEIVKPVIHEVLEAIQPIRKITQEVRPVVETINQIISRGQEQQQAVASVGVVGSIAKPSASAVASNFLQKPIAFPQQSLDISIAKPQLAIPQISQQQPAQAALAGNQLQQIQQITQQLIDKAKKAAAARRAA